MRHARRNEEQVPRCKAMPLLAVAESPTPFDNDVDLVLGVGFLRIMPSRSVELDTQGPAGEQLNVALAFRPRQPGERVSHGELMLHAVATGRAGRRPMSRKISRAA